MRIAIVVTLVSLAFTSTACGTEVAFIASGEKATLGGARAPEDVVLLMTTPERSYVEAGFITARAKSSLSSKKAEDMYRELRAEGAKRGCDAVLILASESDSPGGAQYHAADRGSAGVGAGAGALAGLATTSGQTYRAACLIFTKQQSETAGSDAPAADAPAEVVPAR